MVKSGIIDITMSEVSFNQQETLSPEESDLSVVALRCALGSRVAQSIFGLHHARAKEVIVLLEKGAVMVEPDHRLAIGAALGELEKDLITLKSFGLVDDRLTAAQTTLLPEMAQRFPSEEALICAASFGLPIV